MQLRPRDELKFFKSNEFCARKKILRMLLQFLPVLSQQKCCSTHCQISTTNFSGSIEDRNTNYSSVSNDPSPILKLRCEFCVSERRRRLGGHRRKQLREIQHNH